MARPGIEKGHKGAAWGQQSQSEALGGREEILQQEEKLSLRFRVVFVQIKDQLMRYVNLKLSLKRYLLYHISFGSACDILEAFVNLSS